MLPPKIAFGLAKSALPVKLGRRGSIAVTRFSSRAPPMICVKYSPLMSSKRHTDATLKEVYRVYQILMQLPVGRDECQIFRRDPNFSLPEVEKRTVEFNARLASHPLLLPFFRAAGLSHDASEFAVLVGDVAPAA